MKNPHQDPVEHAHIGDVISVIPPAMTPTAPPAGLPLLPEGIPPLDGEFADFDYFGRKPITLPEGLRLPSKDIAHFRRTIGKWVGNVTGAFHDEDYAVRRGTEHHRLNFPAPAPGGVEQSSPASERKHAHHGGLEATSNPASPDAGESSAPQPGASPRVDAEAFDAERFTGYGSPLKRFVNVVHSDFARTLEIELVTAERDAATHQSYLRHDMDVFIKQIRGLQDQLAAQAAVAEGLREALEDLRRNAGDIPLSYLKAADKALAAAALATGQAKSK